MKTLREVLTDAKEKQYGLGHFNISNIEMLWSVVRAAQKVNIPAIIGVSEGERDVFGAQYIALLIKKIREETGHPLFLNADHTYSVKRVQEAIDAGFDSVIFDGAQLSIDENIQLTKQCVEYARKSGKDVLIEGELGFIGSGSQIIDELPAGAQVTQEHMTLPEDASRFVQETGVDLFAPAVGNLHGTLKNMPDPRLSIPRIKEIHEAARVPLVLHGGSGLPDEDFVGSIYAGISVIHVSTELRIAYRGALEKALQELPNELAPYKYMHPVTVSLQALVESRLRLFAHI